MASGPNAPFGVTGTSPALDQESEESVPSDEAPALSGDSLRDWVEVVVGMTLDQATDFTAMWESEDADAILALVTKPDNRGWRYLEALGYITDPIGTGRVNRA